jgi:predicted alpha/beta-hydrolase family hydrolase
MAENERLRAISGFNVVSPMNDYQEFRDDSAKETPVRGFLHRPANGGNDWLVLTHGAGANCESPLLMALADAFCLAGLTVLRCDLPFRQLRPHGPPPRGSAERDQQGLRSAIASVRKQTSGRVFLGGHSYGGRQSTMLAAQEPGQMDRLLLLSYPLHPPKRPDELRTAHFPRLQVPALFVHGMRDSFGSIYEMETALKLIPARSELLPINGAGHELMARKNRDETSKRVVDAFQSFV